MAVTIVDGKLAGSITVMAQMLYNTGHESKPYPFTVIFDGADPDESARLAVETLVIKVRKRVKTPAQAEALAKGMSVHEAATAKPPKDPNVVASTLDVDALDEKTLAMLMAKVQAKLAQ